MADPVAREIPDIRKKSLVPAESNRLKRSIIWDLKAEITPVSIRPQYFSRERLEMDARFLQRELNGRGTTFLATSLAHLVQVSVLQPSQRE